MDGVTSNPLNRKVNDANRNDEEVRGRRDTRGADADKQDALQVLQYADRLVRDRVQDGKDAGEYLLHLLRHERVLQYVRRDD